MIRSREMSSRQIKFSIITVCLNAENTILETLRSVKCQLFCNYEYIIWDGKSQDDTVKIIRENAGDDHVMVISEKDSGLYNAMNRALQKCTGDYVLFLNSGDTFADEKVLSDVAEWIKKDDARADLYFGNVLRKREEGDILERYRGRAIVMRLLLAGRMPCHQSIFTRAELMKKYGFDESYSITADYNFLMKCYKNKHAIRYIDRVISKFDCTAGISSQNENLNEMRRQDDRSMKELYPIWFYILKPVKWAGRRLKDFVK